MNYKTLFAATALSIFSISIRAQINGVKLKGKYLGQKPPGNIAEIFAPGIVSTDAYEHSAPAFSPDGNTVLWTIVPRGKPSYLLEMKIENGIWTKPAPPSFTDSTADDIYASFSGDGKKLYFSSRRKLPAGYPENVGTRIWEVEKKENGWGKPKPFDTSVSVGKSFAHSVTNDGTIYFSVSGQGGTNWNMQFSEKSGGKYKKPELLPYSINSFGYEDGPFISPDGSYLIFESERPEGIEGSIDLYISFKGKDGRWSVPENMGDRVNSKYTERFARVSPDGKYLFFGSDRRQSPISVGSDIYWVDAGIIKELKDQNKNRSWIDSHSGIELLLALDNRNFEEASGMMNRWVFDHPNDKGALIDYCTVLRNNNQYADAEIILKNKLAEWPDDINLQAELMLDMLAQNKNEEAENFISSSVPGVAQKRSIYAKLALHYLMTSKNEESAAYYEKALAIKPEGSDFYRLAYAYARDNKTAKAIDALEKAVSYGYGSKQQLENDPGLQLLRSENRFKQLLDKMK